MSLLLDFILVLIFVLCVYTGVKRGFIRSVMSIAVVVLSILGAVKLTPSFSAYLNKNYIESGITEKVEKSIESIIAGVDSINLAKLFQEKPQAFTDILEKFDINFDELNEYYETQAKESGEAEKEVSSYIAKPISETVSNAIAFALLFIFLSILLTVVVLVIDLIVKIPILKGINKSLGMILGILKGGLYAWGLSLIFCNLLPHLAVIYEGKIPASIIDNTVIVRFLGALNISNLF